MRAEFSVNCLPDPAGVVLSVKCRRRPVTEETIVDGGQFEDKRLGGNTKA